MAEYQRRQKLRSLLALCFTTHYERFHFWRSFTSGADGVLFQFDSGKLCEAVGRSDKLECRKVIYANIEGISSQQPRIEDYPFLKRIQFQSEDEFRIIYKDHKEAVEAFALSIQLDWIVKIRLSPWLTPALFETVRKTLHDLPDCGSLLIEPSEMLDNNRWKAALR